ncbi:hypothetical protein LTR22_008726 [Elasticomyces elasticus]|nr:hypothetical protein LTR22_008726 [Elasticomyces elasticus]KAK4923043.1 hypothetical protein LTR49_009705 [Elasticomyces elasticus]
MAMAKQSDVYADSLAQLNQEGPSKDNILSEDAKNALMRLSTANEFGWLWMDMICINQSDNDEKSDQVSMMFNIYQSSQCVFIWLGEEAPDDGRVYTGEIPAGLTHAKVKQFLGLGNRVWWRRLWVWQEIAASHQRRVCIGPHVATFDEFFNVLRHFSGAVSLQPDFAAWSFNDRGAYSEAHAIFDGFRTDLSRDSPRDHTIHTLLYMTTGTATSSPHDRIYALLGISSVEDRNAIKIDYSITVSSLYQHVTEYMVESTKSLDIIMKDDRPRGKGVPPYNAERPCHDLALPTWVPDYSQSLLISEGDTFRRRRKPMGGVSRNTVPDFSVHDSFLRLRAVKVDVIRWTHKIRDDRDSLGADFIEFNNRCSSEPGAVQHTERPEAPLRSLLPLPSGRYQQTNDAARRQNSYGMSMLAFVTEHGFQGFTAHACEPGDVVFVPYGASDPWILRHSHLAAGDGKPLWNLIADCWLGGVMEGGVVDLVEAGQVESELVWLR